MSDPLAVLNDRFGRTEFRSCQKEVVDAALRQQDLLVLLPTGHGKSLCYQLPAVMMRGGFTLVLSPLVALMVNQVDGLRQLGVPAFCVNSQMSLEDRRSILHNLLEDKVGEGSLLYASPELCFKTEFTKFLDKSHSRGLLHRIVVDEAHCCVEWGREFRTEYAKLGELRHQYKNVPMMALTGTASTVMQQRIIEVLGFNKSPRFAKFSILMHRPNLHFEVRLIESLDERLQNMINLLKSYRKRIKSVFGSGASPYPGCGIVYCRSRAMTERIAAELRAVGIGADAFHAGIDSDKKELIMSQWLAGDPKHSIVVATIAFGLGVDKPDTRFVVHFEMPTNIEAYVQQSGRAGRDAKAARCVLYFSRQEQIICTKFAKDSGQDSEVKATLALVNYARSSDRCRHQLLVAYFDGEDKARLVKCQYACDFCKNPRRVQKKHNEWLSDVS